MKTIPILHNSGQHGIRRFAALLCVSAVWATQLTGAPSAASQASEQQPELDSNPAAAAPAATVPSSVGVVSTNEAPSTVAAQAGEMPTTSPEPTMITSENLRIDYLQSVGIFEGNVLVIDPRITVRADKMTVTFSKGDALETASKSVSGTNSTSRSLEKIEATGAVVITEKDRKTQSEHAIYTASDGRVVLTGNPQVESPVGTVTGNKITFWLNEQRMDVESSTRTIFYPDEVKEKNEPTSVGDATDPVDKPTDIDTSPPKPLGDKEKPE